MTSEVGADRQPDAAPLSDADAEAARRVLVGDGRTFVLQPWQIAFLFALTEGRPGVVPPGCGVGKGWLDARLREARTTGDSESLC